MAVGDICQATTYVRCRFWRKINANDEEDEPEMTVRGRYLLWTIDGMLASGMYVSNKLNYYCDIRLGGTQHAALHPACQVRYFLKLSREMVS